MCLGLQPELYVDLPVEVKSRKTDPEHSFLARQGDVPFFHIILQVLCPLKNAEYIA